MFVELFKTESELKLPRNWLQVSFRRVKTGSRDPSATKPLLLNKELFLNASNWFTTVNPLLGKSGRLFKTPLRDYNQEQKFPVRFITRAGITKEIHPWGEESFWKSFFLAFPTPAPKCKTVFAYPHTLKSFVVVFPHNILLGFHHHLLPMVTTRQLFCVCMFVCTFSKISKSLDGF